jgi:hypothetical protein
MIITVLGITIQKAIHPELDLSKPGDAIFNMVSTIIGALVGFISGRAYGRREERESNGNFPAEQKTLNNKKKGQ